MDVEQRALIQNLESNALAYELLGETTLPRLLRAAAAALTPPEGSDQSLLELAATFETCIPFLPSAGQRNIGKAVAQLRQVAMGYVLVPVEPTEAMIAAAEEAHMPFGDMGFAISAAIGARPEVKP